MLATARPLPRTWRNVAVEWKFDGIRCGARLNGGHARLDSRGGKNISSSFPEVVEALRAQFPGRWVGLDGELAATGPDGAPDFGLLQRRLGVRPSDSLVAHIPVNYVIFDITSLDGRMTTELPYGRRRDLLLELGIDRRHLLVPPHQVGVDPAMLLGLSRQYGFEGILIKRLDSRYRPGRSSAWVKVVARRRVECVIGGWMPPARGGGVELGALLLGRPGPPLPGERRLRLDWAGAVGAGWRRTEGRQLVIRLAQLRVPASPFSTELPREYVRRARWVLSVIPCEHVRVVWRRWA